MASPPPLSPFPAINIEPVNVSKNPRKQSNTLPPGKQLSASDEPPMKRGMMHCDSLEVHDLEQSAPHLHTVLRDSESPEKRPETAAGVSVAPVRRRANDEVSVERSAVPNDQEVPSMSPLAEGAEDEQDALDDEVDLEESVGLKKSGRQVSSNVDFSLSASGAGESPSTNGRLSMSTVVNLSFLSVVVMTLLCFVAVVIYVHVVYAVSAKEAHDKALRCVLNGTTVNPFDSSVDPDGLVWYGSVRGDLYLQTLSTVVSSLLLDQHGYAATPVFESLSNFFSTVSNVWATTAQFADDLAASSFLRDSATYFIGQSKRTCNSIWVYVLLPPAQKTANWSGEVVIRVWTNGCVDGWRCLLLRVYALNDPAVAPRQLATGSILSYQLGVLPNGSFSVSSNASLSMTSELCQPQDTSSDEWATQWLNRTLPSGGGVNSVASIDIMNGVFTSMSRRALSTGAQIGLATLVPKVLQDVLTISDASNAAQYFELATDPFERGTTDSTLTSHMLRTAAEVRLPGSTLMFRSSVNQTDVASSQVRDRAVSISQQYPLATQQRLSDGFVANPVVGEATQVSVQALSGLRTARINGSDSRWVSHVDVVYFATASSTSMAKLSVVSELDQKTSAGSRTLVIATVVIGGALAVFVFGYMRAVMNLSSELADGMNGLLENMVYARTMELEKAVTFVSPGPADTLDRKDQSPPDSPSHGRRISLTDVEALKLQAAEAATDNMAPGESVRSDETLSPAADDLNKNGKTSVSNRPSVVSIPVAQESPKHSPRASPRHSPPKRPVPPSKPFSMIREIQVAEEAMNIMMYSLREYRKFLPSTLFVHGEIPLQDELAEELLQAIDSPNRGMSPRIDSTRPSVAAGVGGTSPQASQLETLQPKTTPPTPSKSPPHSHLVKKTSHVSLDPHDRSQVRDNSSRPTSPAHRNIDRRVTSLAVPDTSVMEGSMSRLHLTDSSGPALKRRRGTILTITFVGFLRMSQESIVEAHSASQTFLQIVLSVIDRNEGVVLLLSPDKVVATWNCFKTDGQHEQKGAQCAYELSRTLQAADEEFLFSEHQLAIVVTTGNVAAGTSGTATERASVVEGRCVDLANDLLSLLVAINVRCAVSSGVAEHLQPPLWAVPMDTITDEDSNTYDIFELRSGEEPAYVSLMRKGFQEFKDGDYQAAKELYTEAVKQSVARGLDPAALRMLKLSMMFSKLHTPYIRLMPAWQRFETDLPKDAASPDASPKRRYKSEKRSSYMAEEQLRMELMNLRHNSVANTVASPVRNREGFADDGSPVIQRTPRSPMPSRPDSPPFQSSLNVPYNPERRSSQERRSSMDRRGLSAGSPGIRQRPSSTLEDVARAAANAPASTSPSSSALFPVAQPPPKNNAIEFRDKRDMIFRMSEHVLGKGAVGEVYMGMSESGGLVAIKAVPLPNFTTSQSTGPLNDIQRRRLKRKGINVSNDLEKDVEGLLNEVALLSRLRHENIVGYLSSAIVDKKILVIMEYISGGSLLNLLKEFRGVPQGTAKRYLRDVLKGLQYLHSEDIVHRDIKPQNVLLLIDGSCKLTDFGTCQRMSKLTGVATMEGTPQYMAPEASMGKAEKASDIWSFGILMAQLLTGELPWSGDNNFVTVAFTYRLGHDEAMVPELSDALSSEAQEVIRACCCRDPSQRPTAATLLNNPFFQVVAATPMKAVKKRIERSNQRSPSNPQGSRSAYPSPIGVQSPPKKLNQSTLMKFAAFAEPSSPSPTKELQGAIPDVVVHGPE